MATNIVMFNFADQGIRNVKQTTERGKALVATGEKLGVKVKDIYWTLGEYDGLLVADAPSDEAITALGLSVGSPGNIRTQTMRAFSADEVNTVLAKIP